MLWLYCDNQPFSSPNGPFFEPYLAEMKIWSPRLFFLYMYQWPNATNFQWGKLARELETKTKKNSIIKMSSFLLYDSMHGQYVNSRDGFATIEFFFKGKNTIFYPDQNHVESQ